jgi:hypothetical protein
MGWYIIPLVIVVIILGVAFTRTIRANYRFGSGLFENSEYNLEEKKELSDKDYFDKDGLFG